MGCVYFSASLHGIFLSLWLVLFHGFQLMCVPPTGKIDMVKSKWGLALAAVVTVLSSLLMSVGLCTLFGLTPTLNGGYVASPSPGRGAALCLHPVCHQSPGKHYRLKQRRESQFRDRVEEHFKLGS